MKKRYYCAYASSGCNYPEGQCLDLCVNDQWRSWEGGECPLPHDAFVQYKTRCGITVLRPTIASKMRWFHLGNGGDVVAYRKK